MGQPETTDQGPDPIRARAHTGQREGQRERLFRIGRAAGCDRLKFAACLKGHDGPLGGNQGPALTGGLFGHVAIRIAPVDAAGCWQHAPRKPGFL